MRNILDRFLPWRKWKRRALAAERSAIALRELFAEAKGMSVDEYLMFKGAMLWMERPSSAVKITNVQVPHA